MSNGNKIAIIILAAGASRRLGQPKQLLIHENKTLIQRTIDKCMTTKLAKVFVVLGAKAKRISENITSIPEIEIFINPNWEKGMGNSIAFAASNILINSNFDAAIFSVSDQPFFEEKIIQELIEVFEGGEKSIVVSKYDNGQGPPTLFRKQHFEALSRIDGDEGAKEIIQQNKSQVAKIHFSKGMIDIDTDEDLIHLK